MIVARMAPNSTRLPGKSSRANAYPAMLLNSRFAMTPAAATIALFRK